MNINNIFESLPEFMLPEEIFSQLASGRKFKLKRIVSTGKISPKESWYQKKDHEWVIVLQGAAKLFII